MTETEKRCIEMATPPTENDETRDVAVAAIIPSGVYVPNPSSEARPPSTSRPPSATRANPLAPPRAIRQNHQHIDDDKAASINRLLQITGFLAFVNTIIAISLAAIIGVDVIIGVVLGGIVAGIAGMFVSCGFQHLRSFQIRTAIVVFFSILTMACALAEYLSISQVEACAVVTTKGAAPATEYYGKAQYYLDAKTCAVGDTSPGSHCNCVSDQQDCLRISFSQDCNAVLSKAPQLAVACLIVSMVQFGFALLAMIRLILSTCTCFRSMHRLFKSIVNSMGYEPLPSPDRPSHEGHAPSSIPTVEADETVEQDTNARDARLAVSTTSNGTSNDNATSVVSGSDSVAVSSIGIEV